MLRSSKLAEEPTAGATGNPWSPSIFFHLGSLENVLQLAQKTGHLDKSSSTENTRRKVEGSSSVKLVSLLREITRLGEVLDKVNLAIVHHQRESETADVTSCEVAGKRAYQVETLASHLACVIESKDELVSHLQQPNVGDNFVVDAAYHEDTAVFMRTMTESLASLPTHLENLSWAHKFSVQDGQLASVLSQMESSLAELQHFFQALCRSRMRMAERQEGQTYGASSCRSWQVRISGFIYVEAILHVHRSLKSLDFPTW